MLTYSLLDSLESLKSHGLSYCGNKQYVDKKMKVCHCIATQETVFIGKIWEESQKSGE